MNTILERKLAELVEEAERQGSAAVFAVAQLLHGYYVAGEHNRFAAHCCRITPFSISSRKVETGDDDEFPPVAGGGFAN